MAGSMVILGTMGKWTAVNGKWKASEWHVEGKWMGSGVSSCVHCHQIDGCCIAECHGLAVMRGGKENTPYQGWWTTGLSQSWAPSPSPYVQQTWFMAQEPSNPSAPHSKDTKASLRFLSPSPHVMYGAEQPLLLLLIIQPQTQNIGDVINSPTGAKREWMESRSTHKTTH